MKRHLFLLPAILCSLVGFAFSPTQIIAATTQTFTNPVYTGADPEMEYQGGYYYYVHTQGDAIDVIKTPSMVDLNYGSVTRAYTAPSSGPTSHDIWAPEIHYLQGMWYIYFAADDGSDQTHRLFVLQSANPLGPYTLLGQLEPKNAAGAWAIDPTVFQNAADGSLYILWSGRPGTDLSAAQQIYIASMSNPYTINSGRVSISQPTYAWEEVGQAVNEGPAVIQHDGKTFVTYSASFYTTPDYCLGMLTNTNGKFLNAKSWTKSATPVFQKTAATFGPGGNAFIKSPDGTQDWLVYHAKDDPSATATRTTRVQQFSWNADGTPDFGSPVSSSETLADPSGTPVPDLTVTNMQLTDASGNAKTSFTVGEPIYVQITVKNVAEVSAGTQYGTVKTMVYQNQPDPVMVGIPSDINMDITHGTFWPGGTYTYGSYPGGNYQFAYEGSTSWAVSTPGTYTARAYIDYNQILPEADYTNNQPLIVTYTVN